MRIMGETERYYKVSDPSSPRPRAACQRKMIMSYLRKVEMSG